MTTQLSTNLFAAATNGWATLAEVLPGATTTVFKGLVVDGSRFGGITGLFGGIGGGTPRPVLWADVDGFTDPNVLFILFAITTVVFNGVDVDVTCCWPIDEPARTDGFDSLRGATWFWCIF